MCPLGRVVDQSRLLRIGKLGLAHGAPGELAEGGHPETGLCGVAHWGGCGGSLGSLLLDVRQRRVLSGKPDPILSAQAGRVPRESGSSRGRTCRSALDTLI
jgi:hypothetical protein